CCCHSSAQDARDVAVGNDLPQYSPAVILIFIHPGPRLGRKRRADQATAPHRRGNSPGTRWRGPSVTREGCSPTAPTSACVQCRQTTWVSSHQTRRWSGCACRHLTRKEPHMKFVILATLTAAAPLAFAADNSS